LAEELRERTNVAMAGEALVDNLGIELAVFAHHYPQPRHTWHAVEPVTGAELAF
jgi:hypothetical protein